MRGRQPGPSSSTTSGSRPARQWNRTGRGRSGAVSARIVEVSPRAAVRSSISTARAARRAVSGSAGCAARNAWSAAVDPTLPSASASTRRIGSEPPACQARSSAVSTAASGCRRRPSAPAAARRVASSRSSSAANSRARTVGSAGAMRPSRRQSRARSGGRAPAKRARSRGSAGAPARRSARSIVSARSRSAAASRSTSSSMSRSAGVNPGASSASSRSSTVRRFIAPVVRSFPSRRAGALWRDSTPVRPRGAAAPSLRGGGGRAPRVEWRPFAEGASSPDPARPEPDLDRLPCLGAGRGPLELPAELLPPGTMSWLSHRAAADAVDGPRVCG